MKSIKKKINELREKLLKYEHFYHNLNQSLVSDAEYDYLLNQLYNLELKNKELIRNDSPTQIVGSYILDRFKKVIHFSPMLSLENTFDIDGYLCFEKRINNQKNFCENLDLCCELKMDGVALSIIYENGIFIRASTRGDGYIGENVTANARMIKSIPTKLKGINIPNRLEIRGEVIMLKSDFIKLNNQFKVKQKKFFSNPRNAASGSLRHNNAKITAERKLLFFCYNCDFFDELDNIDSHYKRLQQCKAWGFLIQENMLICRSHKEVYNFYDNFRKKRFFLDFNIDGIVIKVNSISLQKKIGCNTKFPKWAIAFKFLDEEKVTQLISVKFQVGRTGIITPVGFLKPINISGVTVTKASLYNKNEIKRLNIYINDFVIVCRSGDVIPKIISVLIEKRLDNAEKVLFPSFCPSCTSTLIENKDEPIIRCHAGLTCHSQKKRIIHHFFSKSALNVIGLGPVIIEKLIFYNIINNITSVFYLTSEKLQKIDNIKEKKSVKIINAIKNAKKTTFSRFIYALSIPGVGKTASEKLSLYFKDIRRLLDTNILELDSISGIGNIIANNIFNYISLISNRNIIIELIDNIGISWIEKKINNKITYNSFFTNKRIVLTGIFQDFSRNKLIKILIKLGGIVLKKVSKKTDILIYGKKVGIKYHYACQLKIRLMNENELVSLI